jgi:drug/metabolite transporter (DMT)-like permease
VIFGLIAAVGWGSADYLGALAGRRMGSIATVVVGQVLSAAFITVVLLATGSSIGRLRGIVWLVLLNGICTAVAYATHYHALELGPVAVVSPISAAFAVPAIVLAVIVLHERPTPVEIAGIAVTLVGVMLVSTDLRALRAGIRGHPAGLPWAIVSAFGFGLAAFLLGYVSLRAGWIVGLWGSRMAQVACYVPLVLARPKDMGRLRTAGRTAITLALAAGAADIVGVTAYSYGAEQGFLTLVLAASAVFPLIAVVLSYRYLHERLVPNQYGGIALVVAGLLLLALGSR